MENKEIDTEQKTDKMSLDVGNYNDVIRINNMGQIEEYREGYWQIADWKYSSK